ncbi:MAG: hypothetical protein DRJ68_03260 [Thermoprotei archaeon]|nr:MAG: hypothetical protein DRJ68_03260 [Thermoprotei archaeon]
MWRASILAFKLVKGRELVLAVAAFSFSFLFSATTMGLLSLYSSIATSMSGGGGCVVIYDFKSSTPLSGVIPLSTVSLLENLSEPLSPEVLAPCLVDLHVVVVRGVVPSLFYRVSDLKLLEGELLSNGDLETALVGLEVAEELGLKVGDEIILRSIIADRYVKLRVKGVFESSEPLNCEVITPLHVGQWLRGLSYSSITLVRVKAEDPQALSSYLREVLGDGEERFVEAERPKSVSSACPWIEVRPTCAAISSVMAEKFAEKYLNKYGLSTDSLTALSAVVVLLSGVAVYVASSIALEASRFELEVLRAMGGHARSLKLGFLLKALSVATPLAVLGSLSAYAYLQAASSQGFLSILSYSVEVPLNPLIVLLSALLTALLVGLSSLRLDV